MPTRVKPMNNREFVDFCSQNGEFGQRRENLECFPPGHFHSALPLLEDRKGFMASDPTEDQILGIKLDGQSNLNF